MEVQELEKLIKEKCVNSILLIYLTITNNTAARQPVLMNNIKDFHSSTRFDIPFFFDARRFAENAHFIKEFENGYKNRSISSIVKEMFSYVDGFSISFKKDGLANIGATVNYLDEKKSSF